MGYQTDLRKRAFLFSIQILKLVDGLPNRRSYRIIADQLGRSASSIGANIHEAHGAGSRLEFKRFHEIALKSANETKYWLAVLQELQPKNDLTIVIAEANELANMLGRTVITLKSK